MADFPHMDWYCRDYIADTRHLTPEQKGAYTDLLNYAWLNKAQLVDNDAELARMCGFTLRRWMDKIRPAMERFWTIENGIWFQERQQKEFHTCSEKVSKNRANAALGGKAKALNANKSLVANARQTLEPKAANTESDTESDTESERKIEPPHTPPPEVGAVETVKPTRSKSKRGTRLPDGWVPSERNIEDAINSGIPPQAVDELGEQFRDYWVAVPGQRGTKLDWDATWRNRCKDQAPKYRSLTRPKRRNLLDEPEKGVMADAKRILQRAAAARDRGDHPSVGGDGEEQRADGKPRGGPIAVLPDGREVPLHGAEPDGGPMDCGEPLVPVCDEGLRGRATNGARPCDAAAGESQRPVGEDPCGIAAGVELAVGRVVRGSESGAEPESSDDLAISGDGYGFQERRR